MTRFSVEDVRKVVELETALASDSFAATAAPTATLLAGQPGAGKTILSRTLSARREGNAFLINGDEYRPFHPNYRQLHEAYGSESVSLTSAFSAAVTEKLISSLSERRMNLIVEGTGRTVDVPSKTAELLAEKGYTVHMAVIAARPVVSLLGTLTRFYRMSESGALPRATAVAAHDEVVGVLPENLDVLCGISQISGIRIWTRDMEKLYDSAQDHTRPSAVLRAFWSRPWTQREAEDVGEMIERLRQDEARLRLGQSAGIDEAERRFQAELAGSRGCLDLDAAAKRLCQADALQPEDELEL